MRQRDELHSNCFSSEISEIWKGNPELNICHFWLVVWKHLTRLSVCSLCVSLSPSLAFHKAELCFENTTTYNLSKYSLMEDNIDQHVADLDFICLQSSEQSVYERFYISLTLTSILNTCWLWIEIMTLFLILFFCYRKQKSYATTL